MQPQADPFIVPLCHDTYRVLYADDDILLIDKPTGLLSLSGKHPLNLDSLHHRLVKEYPTAKLLHRLDFGTSGIMLVALNKPANGNLTRQFQDRTISKSYTAILHGHLADDTGRISLPIAKDVDHFPLQKICHDTGKTAISDFRVIERLEAPQRTRVEFTPVSGRTHQLRIHSQQIDHPILGCDLYATDEAFFMAERLMLHAEMIAFDHPVSGERMEVRSPCPF
ncbi:RluA family pseudouridine synthase [Cobetia crustatorum]|uniref:RluA family pseudouridine synthase n=1 Tax=Cobetia crustatorum TaxID=553385 RepID=A0A558HKR8_9GAMM|nr:RluA family pseudouridine synthase [Cobetia crustatorum]TVU69732.1 RluA family pseudouridine synthase [Cobetia crustatorum]